MLTPLSWIYTAGMKVRNWGFEQGLVRSERLSVPVVSVGNLTAGGTGKPPLSQTWSIGPSAKIFPLESSVAGIKDSLLKSPESPVIPRKMFIVGMSLPCWPGVIRMCLYTFILTE